MADNKISESMNRNKGLDDMASELNSTEVSTKVLTDELAKAALAIKSFLNESSNFKNVTSYVDEATKSISELVHTANSMNLGEQVTKQIDSAGRNIVDLQGRVKDFSLTLQKAFNTDGSFKLDTDIVKIMKEFNDLNLLSRQVEESMKSMGNNASIPQEALKSINETREAMSKLVTEYHSLAKVNPGFGSLEGSFKSLRQQIKDTSETFNSEGKKIREDTLNILSTGNNTDGGTIAILNQMSNAVNDLGKVSTSNNKAVGNMYSELQKLGSGVDVSGVTKGLEDYSYAMTQLEKAKNDLNKVLSDDHLSQDANRVHEALTKVMTIEEQLVQTGKRVSEEYKNGGIGTLGLENYQKFNDELGGIIKNYDELARSAQNAGLQVDNAISDSDYKNFAQGGANAKAGRVAKVGKKIASKGLDLLEGGVTKSIGLGKTMAGLTGLGALTSGTGIIRDIFSAQRVNDTLWRDGSLADQAAGNGDQPSAFKGAMNQGINWAYRTYGTIDAHDVEKNRQELTKNVQGHYGQNADTNVADMSALSKDSTLYQKGKGISDSTMNQAINQFYKDFNMNLTDTEYLLSKVADRSTSLNIPMEQHLKNVMQLSSTYRDLGLGVNDADNALTNLIKPNGAWGMNQQDAMRTATNVGQGIGGLSDGWAAYAGMQYNGASNPYGAIWDYKNKWNADGSERKDWAKDATHMVTGATQMYKDMGGNDPNLQKYLQYQFYKGQMGMDEKTSVQLANTNDPKAIEKILKDTMGDSKKSEAGKEAAVKDTQDKLISQIATASDHLSGTSKTLGTLETAESKLALSQDGWMSSVTNYSKEIRGFEKIMEGKLPAVVDTVKKSIETMEHLSNTMDLLIAALALLGLGAPALKYGAKKYKGAKDWVKEKRAARRERNNRPGEGGPHENDPHRSPHNDPHGSGHSNPHNDPHGHGSSHSNTRRTSTPHADLNRQMAQRRLNVPTHAAEEAVRTSRGASKLAKFGSTALKLGKGAFHGLGGIPGALIDPLLYFGGAAIAGHGHISKKAAKEATKDTATSWAAVGTGALTGAAIGSVVPGVGTVIGGTIGGIAGGVADAFGHDKFKKFGEKATKDLADVASKAGTKIVSAGSTIGGFFSKTTKSIAKHFSDSGKDTEKGSSEAKTHISKAGTVTKLALAGLGNPISAGAALAGLAFGKAGKDSESNLSGIGKHVSKGYDKAGKDIKDKKGWFDNLIGGLFHEDDKKTSSQKKSGGFWSGVTSGFKHMFGIGDDKKDSTNIIKDTKDNLSANKGTLKVAQNHYKTGEEHFKEAKDQSKTIDKHLVEAKDQGKTMDKHLVEAKDQGKTMTQYMTETFPKGHKEIMDTLDSIKKLSDTSKKAMSDMTTMISTGLSGIISAINSMGGMSGTAAGITDGSDNAGKIWNFFSGKGVSAETISGIMGNLQQESNLDPKAPGGGLAQWIGSRKSSLNKFAKKQGLSSDSLDAQLGYLWQEMSSGNYVDISKMNGMSASEAAKYFEENFEKAGKPMMSKRVKYANSFMDKYGSLGGDAGGDGLKDPNDIAKWYLSTYNVTSRFGQKEGFRAKPHNGLDLDGKIGDLIDNIANGTITKVSSGHHQGEVNSLGNEVDVKLADGRTAIYGHLEAIAKGLKVGQKISAGSKIGNMGNTGSTVSSGGGDGSHLHLGLKDANGNYVDPEKWLDGLSGGNGNYSGGDAGGTGLKASATMKPGGFLTNSGQTSPIYAHVGVNSIYANGHDMNWSTRGLYSGSIGYSNTGVNYDDVSRKSAANTQNMFQINVYADPSKDSQYYKELSAHVKTAVDKAQKEFAEKWAKARKF